MTDRKEREEGASDEKYRRSERSPFKQAKSGAPTARTTGRSTGRAGAMAAAVASPKAAVTALHAAKLATVSTPAADPSPADGDTQAATTFAPGASARSGLSSADTMATTAAETGPVTKGFATALQELRSSDPADRLAGLGKHHHVSEVECRRKAHKIDELAPRLHHVPAQGWHVDCAI